MKPLYLVLAGIFCFQYAATSQTYYTLTSGNWNNTTNVWSLNGTTPCGCFPGNTLVSDTLYVSHPLNLTAHINASATSKIQVGNGGSMSNALFDVTISNSIVLAEGNLNIKKLTINAGGLFQLNNSVLMVNGSSDVFGQFNANNSDIQLLAGNVQVFPSGNVQLTNGTRLHFSNGNYRNEGITSVCSTCCISSDKGSMLNVSGANFSGAGAVQINNGSIKNYSTWDSGITWCASGADVGMTSTENCLLSDQICTFGPLATDLISFEGNFNASCLELYWVTSNYVLPVHFLVEQLQPSSMWQKIDGILAFEELESVIRYRFATDCTFHSDGVFRLSAFDKEGGRIFTSHTSVFREEVEEVRLFPNPSKEEATLLWPYHMEIEEVIVQDYLGRNIFRQKAAGEKVITLKHPGFPGVYRVILVGNNTSELRWVVL
jgi:hypothetical protein